MPAFSFLEALESRTLLSMLALDHSFGHGGSVEFPVNATHEDTASAVASLPNGRIIVAGLTRSSYSEKSQIFLARFSAGGRLDRSFANNGL